MQQLEQKTRKEAKEEIIAVKNKLLEEAKAARKKCETKEASLDSRIQEVVQREESVSVKESDLNSEIKTKAESLVISKKSYLERIYEDETHNMQSKYQQMVIAYKGIMFFAMFYGFIITLITALNTDSFASDCVIFVKTIYGAAKTVFGWIISVGSLAAKIGDMIPVDILAAIAHWLILIIVSGVLVYGVALIFFRIGKQYVDFLLEKQADDISAVVGLSILAIIVFMADSIKAFISINLTGLMVLVFVMYSAVRGWVQANSQRF